MSQNRHSSIGIHGQPAGAKGIHRLRLLKSTQKYALGVLVVLGIGAAIVIGLRVAKAAALAETSREQATRYVNVVTPKPAPADSQKRLSMRALTDTCHVGTRTLAIRSSRATCWRRLIHRKWRNN